MKIEDLTTEQLAEMAKNGNQPHQVQMNESGLNYNNLPAELKSQVRSVELALRTSKSQEKIEANLKKSVIIADQIITLAEQGRQAPPAPPTGPTPEEIEAKRLADEAEAKRLSDESEAKRLADEAEAKRLADEEAKRKRSFGNSALDTIFGVH